MTTTEQTMRKQLRESGLTARAIDAVWPEWWSAEAEDSLSAATELRYTLARRLGIAPSSLFDGPPRFVWKDEARFKNLGTANDHEAAVLASFAVSVGRCAISATPLSSLGPEGISASELRASILATSAFVGLDQLLATAWGLGIPVLHLAVFPLAQKRMHAVSARVSARYALLIGRESKFASQVAYYVAHELGHVALQHVADHAALLDVDDPLRATEVDEEEDAADRFALELLTGTPEPDIVANVQNFTGAMLRKAAMDVADEVRVEPGVIALCLAHRTGKWQQAMAALKGIPPGAMDIGSHLNDVAMSQFDWSLLSVENQDFLRTVMGRDGHSA